MKARVFIAAFASMMLVASALSASAATRPTPARMEKGAPAKEIGKVDHKKVPAPPAHKVHKKAKSHAHIEGCHRQCDRHFKQGRKSGQHCHRHRNHR